MSAVATVRLNREGVERIRKLARMNGMTLRQYMEGLMHYAISTFERSGSWEANKPFDPADYREGGYADRWF